MNKLPFFPFYAEDWLNGTRGLKNDQKAFYIDLICLLWARGGRLPNDAAKIEPLLSYGKRKTERLLRELISAGKVMVHGDAIGNGRIDEVMATAIERSDRAAKREREKASNAVKNGKENRKVSSKLDANFDQTSTKLDASFDQTSGVTPTISMTYEAQNEHTRGRSYISDSIKKENKQENTSPPASQSSDLRPCGPEPSPLEAASELAGLNGSTVTIVTDLAKWLNPLMPDPRTAKGILASNINAYSADAVKQAHADLVTDMAGGRVIANPLQAFKGYAKRAHDRLRAARVAECGKPAGTLDERTRATYEALLPKFKTSGIWPDGNAYLPRPGTPESAKFADLLAKHGLHSGVTA